MLMRHGDEAVEPSVETVDAPEQRFGHLTAGNLTAGQCLGELGQCLVVHGRILRRVHSTTRGTRYKPLSTAGAMRWKWSRWSCSVTSSARSRWVASRG